MKTRRTLRLDILVYLLVAIFWFWLAAQIPYTHDDWDWGLEIGMQQLLTANLNGRYAGNLLEVIMTRSELARIALMGSGFFLLPLLMASAILHFCKEKTHTKRLLFFIAGNILLLSMPRTMWQQTYGWTAGYANFVASALFMVIVFGRLLQVFDKTPEDANRFDFRCVGLFLITLAGQLFIENISIYIVVLALVANVIHLVKTKKLSWAYLSILLGAVIGLVIVFSSSIYRELWDTGAAVNGYRKMFVNSNMALDRFLISCLAQATRLTHRTLEHNYILVLAITVLLNLCLLLKQKLLRPLPIVCFTVNCLFVLYFIWNRIDHFVTEELHLSMVSSLFFLVVALELPVIFRGCKGQLSKLLCIWLSVAGVMVPLVVTSEYGPRMFFTSNIFLILFALFLLESVLETAPKKTVWWGLGCSLVILGLLLGGYGKVYYEIGQAKDLRNATVAQAVADGSSALIIPKYPHTEYIWRPNPVNTLREGYFREFHGLPADTYLYFE